MQDRRSGRTTLEASVEMFGTPHEECAMHNLLTALAAIQATAVACLEAALFSHSQLKY
jgi:hypothetical protein